MNKKWFRIRLTDGLKIKEVRDWCEENCYYSFRVRQPRRPRIGVLTKKPYAIFQSETDAMAFKMRWM